MWVFYFVALPHIELAVAAAAYYTLPLFIMLFAAIFLSETITARGWLAVVLGFIGTLLILQPQADDFNTYALLPVVAAICYACAMIMTRSKCRHEQPVVLSLWLNVSFVSVGALALLVLYICDLDAETQALNPFLLGEWTPMWLDEWRIMALLAIAFVVGSIGAAIAYQKGPPSIIAIYDYSYVAFAIVWGVLIFAEIPSSLVTAGIVMIVAAGIVSIRQRST
jgi:drug/metabolite transporter (DMT)-like permease